MKEKTREDLGLDEGEEYLKQMSLEFDLGELGDFSNILDKKTDKEDAKNQIEEIKKKV